MNFHITTPTEAKAVARHKAFHEAIERKASELQSAKLLEALRERYTPQTPVRPELFPAETDPPRSAPIPISISNRIAIIQRLTCDIFGGITLAELKSSRKNRDLCGARQIAMYLCKKYTSHSFPTIGRAFTDKDHTTVLHACRRIEKILSIPPGCGLGIQTPPAYCDMVREKTAIIRAALLDIAPQIGADA